MDVYKCVEIPLALKKGETRTMIIIIFHSFLTCVMRSLLRKPENKRPKLGKADDDSDFRPSFFYRMLNQMQRLKYDRKSHTHVLPVS